MTADVFLTQARAEIERIVLEWRLDPAGSHRIPDISADRAVIVFCNEGYASTRPPPLPTSRRGTCAGSGCGARPT